MYAKALIVEHSTICMISEYILHNPFDIVLLQVLMQINFGNCYCTTAVSRIIGKKCTFGKATRNSTSSNN